MEEALQLEAWSTCRSSFFVGVFVGVLLASLCTPFVGLTNTLRMVLQAQMGSLAIAASGQLFSVLAAYWNGAFQLSMESGLWALESAMGACSFSVGNLCGASCGGILGTFLSIRLGSVLASDIEEEWVLLSQCAIKGVQRLAVIGDLNLLKRIVALRAAASTGEFEPTVPRANSENTRTGIASDNIELISSRRECPTFAYTSCSLWTMA